MKTQTLSNRVQKLTVQKLALPFSGIAVLAAVLGLSQPAQAGEWVPVKYVYSGDFRNVTNTLYGGVRLKREISYQRLGDQLGVEATKGEKEVEGGGWFTGYGKWDVSHGNMAGTPPYPIESPGPLQAQVNCTVRAVWRWVRNDLYDEEGNFYPDPNDNPPDYVWVREFAHNQLYRSHGIASVLYPYEFMYSAENPYDGSNITIDALECRFGTQSGQYERTGPFPGGGDLWFRSVLDHQTGTNLFKMSTQGQDVITLPAATFRGSAHGPALDYGDGQGLAALFIFDYQATPVQFAVRSRRKGSGQSFGSATIAAGGQASDEHLAEIEVEVREGFYPTYPVPNVPLSRLPKLGFIASTANGEANSATLLPPTNENATTDGGGRAIVGVVQSRDMIDGPQKGPVVVELQVSKSYNPATNLYHVWDQQGDWKQGATSSSPITPSFDYDSPVVLTFRPKFEVPITGHSMRFLAEEAYVTWYNPFLNVHTTSTARDLGGASAGVNDALVKFTPRIAADLGDGKYISAMTVPKNPTKVVHWFKPAAEDQDAYEGTVAQP